MAQFNTLHYYDRLRAGDIVEQQAKMMTEALDKALSENLATKADIQRLDDKIDVSVQRLDDKIDHLEVKLETKFNNKLDLALASVENKLTKRMLAMSISSFTLTISILGLMIHFHA